MKKTVLVLVLGLGIAVSFGVSGFAEEGQQGMMEGGGEQGMMQGHGKGKMNPMMMGMMHKDSLVATSDGGVVILSGPRLLKYDAELTLVKEVELPKGKKQGPPPQGEEGTPEENPKESAPIAEG